MGEKKISVSGAPGPEVVSSISSGGYWVGGKSFGSVERRNPIVSAIYHEKQGMSIVVGVTASGTIELTFVVSTPRPVKL